MPVSARSSLSAASNSVRFPVSLLPTRCRGVGLAEIKQHFGDTRRLHLHGKILSDYRVRRVAECKSHLSRTQYETHICRLPFQATVKAQKYINGNFYIGQNKLTRDDRQNLILSMQTLTRKTIFQTATFAFITYRILTTRKLLPHVPLYAYRYIDKGRCTTDRAKHSGGNTHTYSRIGKT